MRRYLQTFRRLFPGIHGVWATLVILLGFFALIYVLGATQGFFLRDFITSLDQNVHDLVLTQRGDTRSGTFLFFTYLANWEIVASLSIVILALMILARKVRAAWFFVLALLASQLSSSLLKHLLERNRPDPVNALIEQGGYSFPSGHALGAFVFYGIIGYFLYFFAARQYQKIAAVLSSLAIILLIGISRLYLGVHWLSDVIAGWLMGAAILLVFIVFFERRKAFFPIEHRLPMLSKHTLVILGILLAAAELGFIINFYLRHPLP